MINKSSKIIMIVSITLASIMLLTAIAFIAQRIYINKDILSESPEKIIDIIMDGDEYHDGIRSSSAIDGTDYTCFDKVYISIALADRYQDSVYMKVPYNEGDDSFYIGDENKIITGKINALYKFDKTVIVMCDDVYYVIDTDEYTVPQNFEEGKNIDYKPDQYSEKEFRSKYPNYKSFECFYSRLCQPVADDFD